MAHFAHLGGALIGIIIVLYWSKRRNIFFYSTKWLYGVNDAAHQQLGWYFFQNDVWRFPPGSNPNYGLGISSSIVYTDSIPILAIFFKLLKETPKNELLNKEVFSQKTQTFVTPKEIIENKTQDKIIKEGDDVTKKFATVDREIVHKSTLPDSKTDVLVTQDLNTGDVLVDIGAGKHGFGAGHLGQPVRLEYKASELIEPDLKTGKGGGKTKDEFWVEEAEFTGGHPENVKFEETTINKFGKHESDFSEVEAFAKGKTKKDARKVSESLEKQGEDLADHFSNYPEPDDFSSGGRVSLSAGGLAGMLGE